MHNTFMAGLSSPELPVPGGGAAAAYAGSVGLALLKKIIRLEKRRHHGASEASPWKALLDKVSVVDKSLYRLRDEDGKNYMRLAEAKGSGKGEAEVALALKEAIDCPMKMLVLAQKALGYVSQAAERCKEHLLPDLSVICELLGATICSADRIIQANLQHIADPITKADYQNRRNRCYDFGCQALKLAEASILQRKKKS
jgi:formiminotetrahydrofolate cyclodeaminase